VFLLLYWSVSCPFNSQFFFFFFVQLLLVVLTTPLALGALVLYCSSFTYVRLLARVFHLIAVHV
jgi:hypothetical protein